MIINRLRTIWSIANTDVNAEVNCQPEHIKSCGKVCG
jgi:hypothetical protein